MAEVAVSLKGLGKTFSQGEIEVRALDGIDLDVAAGSLTAVMGPSGSGKSTLLNICGALDTPTTGDVIIAGSSLRGLSERELTRLRRDHIGFVFQFFNLLPTLSAEENVLLPALIAGDNSTENRERADQLLELVGLSDRKEHLPSQLSGGQQQRVSIARALLRKPQLILADEPTGNLDSKAGDEVLALLRQVCREYGHTVLMVSHDPHNTSLADRVIFLRDGRLAGEVPGGDPKLIIEQLQDLEAVAA